MKVVALAERDHLLCKGPHFFGLRQSRHQPSMIKQVRDEISQHRSPMRGIAAEFPMCIEVSHTVCSVCAGMTGRPCSSTFMPSWRPMLCRISLISLSDLRPKFFVLSISASVYVTSSPMVRMFAFFRQL